MKVKCQHLNMISKGIRTSIGSNILREVVKCQIEDFKCFNTDCIHEEIRIVK